VRRQRAPTGKVSPRERNERRRRWRSLIFRQRWHEVQATVAMRLIARDPVIVQRGGGNVKRPSCLDRRQLTAQDGPADRSFTDTEFGGCLPCGHDIGHIVDVRYLRPFVSGIAGCGLLAHGAVSLSDRVPGPEL